MSITCRHLKYNIEQKRQKTTTPMDCTIWLSKLSYRELKRYLPGTEHRVSDKCNVKQFDSRTHSLIPCALLLWM